MATKNLGRVQGLSAYEVWIQQGNTGTEQDFLNGLKGVDGNDYILTDADKKEISDLTSIPTKVSELENDSKFVNETYVANKIAEAELSGGDVDLSGLATKDELNNKVDKVTGKSLMLDTEIERLANVNNYDDTELRSEIGSKASIEDMTTYIEEHKEELKGVDGVDGQDGKDGTNGSDGADGYSPTATVTETSTGATIIITDKNGTTTTNITNGKDGAKGDNGTDGVGISSVTQTTTSTADGGTNVITVTKTDGTTSTFSVRNGSKGSTGVNGADGYTPVKGTDYWTEADKNEIIDEVTGSLDIEGIPSYVREEAERCARVVQGHQNENTMTAILSSDYHLPNKSHAYYSQILESITHAGQAMGILRKQISRDFEAKLGDIVWDSGETPEEALETYRLVHSLVSERGSTDEFEANGNHDHLQSNDTRFTDSQVFANLGIYNKGAVFDETNRKGGYCYRDYKDFYIRVILLNTSETDTGSFVLSSKQIAWLQKALDVDTAEGWGTVILSHHPLDWGGSNTQVMNVIKGASGIICNIHGHVHTYTQDVITGTTIPRLAIPNVCFYRTNEYGNNNGPENAEGLEFGTTTTYKKTTKTGEDTSFCVMSIDRVAGKLYLDHYGAGIDREVDIPKITRISYTNMVKLSQEVGSTNIYMDPDGYKDGCYASGANEGTDDTCVLTGLIPYGYAKTAPLYIKGATLDTANSHCRILGFNAAKQCSFQAAQGNAILTYFNVETLGTDYYKVTPLGKSESGAANTDYLRISLYGTGKNLIITIDEPIA